ncbi:hypothetical protein Tco_0458928, partial [Tanacetum coccineum]
TDDEDPEEDDDEDPEEDPSEEHDPEDEDEDPEEDPREEHEPEDKDAKEDESSKDSDETKPFEENKTAATPPPPRHHEARISVRPQTPMNASTQALIDASAAGPLPSPPLPLPSPPPINPTYDQAPLGHRATMICMRDDIPEEDMPPWKRFVLTAPPPGCHVAESSAAATARASRGQYDFVDVVGTGQGLIRSPGHDARTMARAANRAEDVGYARKWESKDFYTQLLDAQTDRKDIRLEIDVVRVYRGFPLTIHGNVMSARPKTLDFAIDLANDLMDQKLRTYAERQNENKRKADDSSINHHQQQPHKKQNVARAYIIGPGEKKKTWKWHGMHAQGGSLSFEARDAARDFNVITGFVVIIGWIGYKRYHGVIICDEKIVRVPFKKETLIFQGDGSNQRKESRLNIISCTKAQGYLSKGCDVFLAHITTKEDKDKSEEKRLEDVPIVRNFPEVFSEDLSGLPPTRQVEFQIDLVPGVAPVA